MLSVNCVHAKPVSKASTILKKISQINSGRTEPETEREAFSRTDAGLMHPVVVLYLLSEIKLSDVVVVVVVTMLRCICQIRW